MTKLRTLILVLVLCGVAPTASADDFWTASMPGDTALFAPAVAMPTMVAPAVVAPTSVAPSYTDLLILDQLQTMNQTLRDIESDMREALHREAWDRMLRPYRN